MKCIKCKAEIQDGSLYCNFCGKKQITARDKPKTRTRGNGQGSVYKEGKGWVAEVTLGYRIDKDGKQKRVKRKKYGFRTKTEAIEYLPVLANEVEKPQKIALNDLWNIYKENALKKLSASKQGHYNTAYAKIEDIAFWDLKILDIETLQNIVNEKAPTFYPARDIKTLLSHLYDMAVAQQYVTVNLAQHIELPKMHEESPNPFTESELQSLWQDYAAGNYITGYALLMIYTGMMPGELFDLKTSMINLQKHEIIGVGKKTKKRKETPIVLADCIVPVVEELMTHAKGGKFLPFREDEYRREFKKMLARCNCRSDLVPYSCRHTTATSLALENIAMPIIGEVMRHTKISTTQRYVHINSEASKEAVNQIKTGKSL